MRAAVGISRTFFQSFGGSGRFMYYVHSNIAHVKRFRRFGKGETLSSRREGPGYVSTTAAPQSVALPKKWNATRASVSDAGRLQMAFRRNALQSHDSITPSLHRFLAVAHRHRSGKILCHVLARRGGRVVDGSGLENRQGASPRGFESHPLRQTELRICDCRLWIWCLRATKFDVSLANGTYSNFSRTEGSRLAQTPGGDRRSIDSDDVSRRV